jgi:DNA-binding MarR family transcriptional regulator
MSTNEDTGGRRRGRNSVLEALETFRALDTPRAFHGMILFLYVCENEGLNVSELAYVADMQVATTARVVNILSGDGDDNALQADDALFEFRTSPNDRRLKFVHLSERGRALRDRMERIIAQATPVVM